MPAAIRMPAFADLRAHSFPGFPPPVRWIDGAPHTGQHLAHKAGRSYLIHVHRVESEWHEAAVARLVALGEGAERCALPVFCVTEFMRVVTHKRVFNPPSTVEQAADFIDTVVASPSCEIARPGAGFLEWLLTTAREADSHGNLMFDAQIAAVCREHGIERVLTNDSDFERFGALQVQRLA